jgi:CubicO group peptidase (beta-lactamase class C family)
MSGWPTGILVALVTSAALLPLELSVRRTHATHEEAKPQLPEAFDVAAVDRYVAAQVKAKGFVGLSLAVVRDGKIVLAKGYGESSREDRTPVDADTAFAVGSITKQFTCAAALMLAEEGKLSLDDKVAKYFPKLTRAGDITLGDLGAHVSGYPDYYPLDFMDKRLASPIFADDLLRTYAGGKLDFEPGTRWSYSNTGYILLGRVLEKVTLEPLAALFEQRIFTPLHLLRAWYQPKAGAKGLARGYESFDLGEPEPAPREAEGWLGAAGALYASATDLAKWDIALMDGKVLKPESMRQMTTPRTLADGRSTGYGCGLAVSQQNHETVLSHSGEVNGFLASNTMVPRTHSAVILLSNSLGSDPFELGHDILKVMLHDLETPPPKVAGPPAKEVVRALVAQMQSGALDRTRVGDDFSAYVTDARAKTAAAALAPLGTPKSFDLERTSERGGMEVTRFAIAFEKRKVSALMFRSLDGKVQELLLEKE